MSDANAKAPAKALSVLADRGDATKLPKSI